MPILRRQLVVAALTMTLVGAMGAFAPTVEATPTPAPNGELTLTPTPASNGELTLTPTSGPPGTVIEAIAVRLKCSIDLVEFSWMGREDVTWSDPVPVDGNLGATTTVPDSFSPGSYEVRATCNFIDGAAYVSEPFSVTPVEPEAPVLALDPRAGPAGSEVTATASGHPCDGEVAFLWHGDLEAGRAPPGADGIATVQVAVPDDAAPGDHDLLARCEADGFVWPLASFTVTGVEVTDTPVLTLDPRAGPAGSEVTATASGHSCDGVVVFRWDADGEAGRAQSAVGSLATARVTVPTDFAPGGHDLLARCEADGFAWPLASFTVTEAAAVTPTGSGWWESPWWPAVGVLVVLLGALLTWLRVRRGAGWVHAHVRAGPGAAARAGVEAAESPLGRPPDLSIRIEPHADSGTHTVREVGS